MQGEPWRALHRCTDLHQARAVATAIAAMEYDARVCEIEPSARRGVESRAWSDTDPFSDDWTREELGRAMTFVVEVPAEDWSTLADVLDEIVLEQQEFDRRIEDRRRSQHARVFVVIGAATIAELAIIWQLLRA